MDIHEDGSTCIRFTANEANATSIALKVKCELELEEPVVLLNWKRQRIADSPETHGNCTKLSLILRSLIYVIFALKAILLEVINI